MPPKVDPKKPKGSASAYACFVKFKREEARKNGEEVAFVEFSKRCADEWKELSNEEKGPYAKMADKDKKRYEKEMKRYKPSPGYSSKGKLEGGKKRRKRKEKDELRPKRALSGFLYFSQEKRPLLKKQHPNATVGDLAKLLGVDWKKLSDAEKKPYEARASEDRKRYDREMKEYQLKKSVPAEDDEEEDEEDEDGVSEDED